MTASGTTANLGAFLVRTSGDGPRFLGLRLGERNCRVAARAGGICDDGPVALTALPTLIVPDDAIVTPTLFDVLPPPDRCWRLERSNGVAPLEWRGASNAMPTVVMRLELPPGIVLDASTRGARFRSAWQLLRASAKPTDGWLSRHVHRKISRIFSFLFLSVGLTANHATGLTFLIGVASAYCMAQTSHGTMILGALLFWFASIADGIDGEMARLTLTESARGERIDTMVDQATYLLCYAGVTIGWYRQGIGRGGVALAAVLAIGTIIALGWAMGIVRRAKHLDGYFVAAKPIETALMNVARTSGTPAIRVTAALFVLLRREAFSFTFFAVSLVTGARVMYPILIAGGLTFAIAAFMAYGGEIERAIQ